MTPYHAMRYNTQQRHRQRGDAAKAKGRLAKPSNGTPAAPQTVSGWCGDQACDFGEGVGQDEVP